MIKRPGTALSSHTALLRVTGRVTFLNAGARCSGIPSVPCVWNIPAGFHGTCWATSLISEVNGLEFSDWCKCFALTSLDEEGCPHQCGVKYQPANSLVL